MNLLGIDVGSLNTKAVVLGAEGVLARVTLDSGDDVDLTARQAAAQAAEAAGLPWNEADWYIVSTGHGGKAVTFSRLHKSITTCTGRGAAYLMPTARVVIDMGAESTTVLKVNARGRLSGWENQDKCASGTGIFLQQMSNLMHVPIAEMSELALAATGRAEISNTCAVFSESEVISHVHRVPPTPMPNIAAGIYGSMVSRVMAMLKRIGIEREVALVGGVARHRGMQHILEQELGFPVLVPDDPETVGALGAAIIAREQSEKDAA
jgi:predicted CoA-substrate-specific enzyme activase